MTKQAILRDKAEDLVRRILTETFGQKTDNKVIADAAAKIVRTVPTAPRKSYPVREDISSNDQT